LVDILSVSVYNKHMMKTNDILQWAGAVAIIAMHVLNAMGPEAYPYNIIAAFAGTVLFLTWTIRVRNAPQFTVNVIALAIGFVGLYKAFG
jgi:4-alpha-glucanotransferase